jgi:large subunit ribosomal protein L18
MKRLFNKTKNNLRKIRHARIRTHLMGSSECPRLSVFRSLKNISAQLIDDEKRTTICSADNRSLSGKVATDRKAKKAQAYLVGQLIGQKAKEKNIAKVVFDRGGYAYHGRVKALADGARESGLQF